MCAEITGAIEHHDHEGAEEYRTGQKQNALGDSFLLGAGLVVIMNMAIMAISAIIGAMRRRKLGSIQQMTVVIGDLGRSSFDRLHIAR